MIDDVPPWSIRSVVVSVRDLERSSTFYQDVMQVRELFRENRIAVLSSDRAPWLTVYLREAYRNAVHSGQQTLGARWFFCDVGSLSELDRVEGRLRALDGFVRRELFDESDGFEMVHGHDPDRLSLVFVAQETNLALPDYRRVIAQLYALDL
jgi:catechol 2,3-dioxygenase-like lactoylglutathione lyase family enzyme